MDQNTSDLMQKLASAKTEQNLEKYVKNIDGKYPQTYPELMKIILENHNLTIADVQKKSGIDRNYIYQIFNGRKNPGRDKIIAIALASSMTLDECQRALEITKEGILYSKNKRDSIIIYAVNNKMSVMELNGLLEEYCVPVLS